MTGKGPERGTIKEGLLVRRGRRKVSPGAEKKVRVVKREGRPAGERKPFVNGSLGKKGGLGYKGRGAPPGG